VPTPEPEPVPTPEPEPIPDPEPIPNDESEETPVPPVYTPPSETPNIVIKNPLARKIVRGILDGAGAAIVILGAVDLASPAFDAAWLTVPALAGYTTARVVFGFSVDTPNTPSAPDKEGRHVANDH
jgi:outer membrane biosynthesis protein TonB